MKKKEQQMPATVPVFVYGTLKKGFPLNQRYMGNSKFVGTDSASGFVLFSLGFYPAMVKLHCAEIGGNSPECRVLGEVWEVPANEFRDTKRMEEGAGYRTEEITTDSGRRAYAFIFSDIVPGNYSWQNTEDKGHSMRAPVGQVVINQDDLPF